MRDYVELTYGNLPFTKYPQQLIDYLCNRYEIAKYLIILDVGCGRGEYLWEFIQRGCYADGVDLWDYAKRIHASVKILMHIPFSGDYDVVFSKSFLEHIYQPEIAMDGMFKALKPGGLCIAMTPDYECCMKGFYADCQHRTPFMQESLAELFRWAGFDDVKCEKFLQSPPLWKAPWKTPFYKLANLWPGKKSNDVIYSRKKYTMLLCSGRKPKV
jgi:SAM-dependent methyltransferase